MRVPNVVQSIRFRLTVLYSTVLFALAGTGLAVSYLVVARTVDARPISKSYEAELVKRYPGGGQRTIGTLEVADVREIESAANLQTLQALRTYSVIALVALFLLSLVIGWVLSGRALRPVRAIARTAEEIQATDLSRRINLAGPRDELRYLADTVDSMLERLDAAFRAQRQLIDDASHELRSPLAIIRANIDANLAAPEATEEERRRAVVVIDRATGRMSRLVEDLLATARRDAPSLADSDVDLAAVAREAGEEHDGHLRYVLGDHLTLIGDHDALRRAASNLLSNALRLSPPGAPVTIGAGRTDGWLWLAVQDEGPGIPAEAQARVFDRFWRAPDAEPASARERRTGLGLAIVRQIVESHGGQVALHSVVGEGSTFVLWLPAPDRRDESPPPAGDPLVPRS